MNILSNISDDENIAQPNQLHMESKDVVVANSEHFTSHTDQNSSRHEDLDQNIS